MSIISNSKAEPGGDDASISGDDSLDYYIPEARERAIPLRVGDLDRLLLADPALTQRERDDWARFSRMVAAIFQLEAQAKLLELKQRYAPLDPDSDCVELEDRNRRITTETHTEFLSALNAVLIRANYRELDVETLKRAVAAPNEAGLNYIPNFDLFEHLKVYVRGETKISRTVRTLKSKFRKQTVVFDGYQRLVVALKFRPGEFLGDYVRPDALYLRMFKDVPHVDMEMHLPEQGTKVRMRIIDKAQIASPFAVSLPSVAFKLLGASILTTTFGIGAIVAAPISAGLNSFFGFQRAKQRHLHRMIRHLYYLTLANNASVFTRLIDSAAEEETKETLLAYYVLWRADEPSVHWNQAFVDSRVESLLRERAGIDLDFEISDALRKLYRLGLVQCDDVRDVRPVSMRDALSALQNRWIAFLDQKC
jgi:hypothetical protein